MCGFVPRSLLFFPQSFLVGTGIVLDVSYRVTSVGTAMIKFSIPVPV